MKQKRTNSHSRSRKRSRFHFNRRWLLIAIIVVSVSAVGGKMLVNLTSADQCWDDYAMEYYYCTYTPSGDPGTPQDPSDNVITPDTYYSPANPALLQSCQLGLDIAFLVDTSGSVQGAPLQQERAAIKSFISALKGQPMMFSTAVIDSAGSGVFTSDTNKAISNVDSSTNYQSQSFIYGAEGILNRDQRSNKQNLVIILTDGRFSGAGALFSVSGTDTLKKAGTRLLVIGVGNIDLASLKKVSGSNVNTGSIYTSDVITTNYDNLGAQLTSAAGQLCSHGSGGGGEGDGGNGDGGSGTGKNGTGAGQSGAGANGGSSATKQTNKQQSISQSSSQGSSQQNQQTTPSPFYDGKLFGAGSDANSASIVAKIQRGATSIYSLIAICLAVTAAAVALWWLRFGRRKH